MKDLLLRASFVLIFGSLFLGAGWALLVQTIVGIRQERRVDILLVMLWMGYLGFLGLALWVVT